MALCEQAPPGAAPCLALRAPTLETAYWCGFQGMSVPVFQAEPGGIADRPGYGPARGLVGAEPEATSSIVNTAAP